MLLVSGCGDDEASTPPPAEPEPLYFEPIGSGQRTHLTDTLALGRTFRDAEAWAAFSDSLQPLAPFAPVDFTQAMVLVAAAPQETGGYSIEFTSVELADSLIVATYVLNAPGTDCLTALGRSVPFAAVMVRRVEGPVRFVPVREEYRCTFGPRR